MMGAGVEVVLRFFWLGEGVFSDWAVCTVICFCLYLNKIAKWFFF